MKTTLQPDAPGMLGALWGALVEPSASVTDPVRRADCRLQSTMLLVLLALGILLGLLPEVFYFGVPGKSGFDLAVTAALLGSLFPLYLLSRRGHPRASALLTAVALVVATVVKAIPDQSPDDIHMLPYVAVALLWAAPFFSSAATAALTVAGMAAMFAIPWLAPSVTPAHIAFGPATFLLGIGALIFVASRHRDRVERIRRAALARSEQQFRDLFHDSPVGIYRADPDGGVRMANPALLRMLGFESVDELEAIDPAVPERSLSEDRLQGIETTWTRGDGSSMLARENVRVCRDEAGETLFYQGAVEDISGIKETQEQLRESQARFAALFESSLDLVFVHDFEGRFIDANDTALRTLGYERDELGSLSVSDLFQGDELARVQAAFGEVIRLGRSAQAVEARAQTKEGRSLWLEATAVRLDTDGQPRAILGVARDVTERREMHARLARADRMASVGLLASGVGHEINNPLSYVLGNLAYAVSELPSLIADPAARDLLQDCLEDAAVGARRVRDIIRDLRTFGRGTEDTIGLVHVGEAMDAAINMATNEIKHRARLIKDYADVPPVMANEGRLCQVFLNLLVNATQAIDEGDAENDEIRVQIRREDGYVVAAVRDTGPGIPAELQDRIFEPFSTTKPSGVGSGLGLSICHNIVTSMKGRIEVERPPEGGTCFVVFLPLPDELGGPRETDAQPASTSPPPRQRCRVLVVDDEPLVGSVIKRLLQRDCDVEVATSGVEAKAVLDKDQAFDLVISDLLMPEMSGMALHEWLTRRAPQLASGMVFMTGGTFTKKSQSFVAQVANPCLGKPLDVERLRQLVTSAKERR